MGNHWLWSIAILTRRFIKMTSSLFGLENGSACRVFVTEIDQGNVTASSFHCSNFDDIKVGQTVRKSKFRRVINNRKISKRFRAEGLAAYLSYSFANTSYSSGTYQGYGFTETDVGSGSAGLNLEYHKLEEGSFGFSSGLTYEFARTVTRSSATIGGISFNNITYQVAPTVAFLIPNANLNFMINQYIYF